MADQMRLQITLPISTLIDREVTKVVAEGEHGFFCLLPRHADVVAALVPGVSSFVDDAGQEHFVALDLGILVKSGPHVRVASANGVYGSVLEDLETLVREEYVRLDEQERRARTALARLEAGTLRRFIEMKEWADG
ncbi:MAG: F0F1 ATP synthase subunit epsilon [Myxococcota bacterium]